MRDLFLKHIAQTSPFPSMLEVEHAKGVYIHLTNGEKIFDLISGICVSSVGHCHADVVEAVQTQVEKYMHTMVYGEFVLSPQIQLAKLLSDVLPSNLSTCYFLNSGSETVEAALKLARKFTGRAEMIACRNAYHGSTVGALSMMSESYYTQAYRPLLPGVKHINFQEEADLSQIGCRTACVIMEPIQAEAGVLIPSKSYLEAVRKRCDEMGALLIFDEIQVGCGRTGPLFAFEQFEVVPDMLLLAKGLGGGMPIGAMITSPEHMEAFTDRPMLGHITTFGGHPVNCAAALATLNILAPIVNGDQISEKSNRYRKFLKSHPKVKRVRQAGLLIAVELEDKNAVHRMMEVAMENGLLLDFFLFEDRFFRIAPPLTITDEELLRSIELLKISLDAL